jgi:MFS family permease
MIGADGVRALAVAGLAVQILLDGVAFWQILAVAFVEGAGSAFFGPATAGALRSVVPTTQLPAAAGAQQARVAAVNIAGPPLGGVLFGLGRAIPFLADAVSYAFSVVSLLMMRTPFQEDRAVERVRLRARVAEGLRFLWHQPFLRTTTFLYGLSNFIGPGVLLVVVVVGDEQGLASGEIDSCSPRSARASSPARSPRRCSAAPSRSGRSSYSNCGHGSDRSRLSSGRTSTSSLRRSSPRRSPSP